ncbi:DUF2726 domain-containing protein [Campylobacter helveticus]|uniref:DUF2726 domain-containing protein n=1 Tax=Campylobacter helveticus TaxID=28898 RepID=UPI00214C9755|nr:DUF2726 domain-containing protein [Campylobacter helveticus]MCR2055675.1 DUF2726 domain-containing protein [Campylobacter helveticus]
MDKSVNFIANLNETISNLEKRNIEYVEAIEANKKLISENKELIVEIKKSDEYKLDLLKSSTTLKLKNLMKRQEFFIHKELTICKKIQENFFVCPQVPLKAFIVENEDKGNNSYSEVFNLYNQLYVDFLFISKEEAQPFAILEFSGEGHYSKNDKIKEKLFEIVNLHYTELRFNEIQREDNPKLIDFTKLKEYVARLAEKLCENLILKKD